MKTQKEEFLKLLRSYQGIIHKVNLVYFPRGEDRKDNFQEIVLQMWKAYPGLRKREKVASWIYSIAINTSILKKRKDVRYVFTADVRSDASSNGSNSIDDQVDFQRLLKAIRSLPEIDRSIMLLYIEDRTYNEIAEIIGLTPSNIGVRINRAKKQLHELLK